MLLVPDPSIERVRPPLSTARPWLGWAGLASVLLHASMFGAALWWMHVPRVVLHPVTRPATVQLVMSPPGSDHNAPRSVPIVKGPPTTPVTPRPAKAAPEKPAREKPAPTKMAAVPKPPAAKQSHLAPEKPQPVEAAPLQKAPAENAVEPRPVSHAFAMNLGAIESDTNALVTGNTVVPPSPDIKFHNRKPSYPEAAASRGEQGTVVLLVHVQPDGLVSSVDVERSSGYSRLDDSARSAVETWHFLPSMDNGQPVESVVPVRIVYTLD